MKTERNLLKSIKVHEYLEVYRKTFESAEIHKKSAEIISKTGHYGIPVSHLILSTEQYVTGIIIYAQHIGFNLKNVPGIHLFFTDHIIKHNFATLISTTYPLMKFMFDYVENSRDTVSGRIQISDSEKTFGLKIKKEVKAMFKTLPEMFDWWDNANLQKNKGFYVDYSNCIETPMQVTKAEYIVGHRIVSIFQNQILEIVKYFEDIHENEKMEVVQNLKLEERFIEIIKFRKDEMKKRNSSKLLEQVLIS